jgi:hypothetical protein
MTFSLIVLFLIVNYLSDADFTEASLRTSLVPFLKDIFFPCFIFVFSRINFYFYFASFLLGLGSFKCVLILYCVVVNIMES